jgi:octopine oxidase subunit B
LKPDIVVIGAGIVGAAIAYGLARRNLRVLVLDGDDRDHRAANANFGLVWVHGKGLGMPAYQRLTRDSVNQWPDFSAEIFASTSTDIHYKGGGGVHLCLSESELQQRQEVLHRLHKQLGAEEADAEMLDRRALEKLFPKVGFGPDVTGASLGHMDGHVNPMRLLSSLQAGIVLHNGVLRGGCPVHTLRSDKNGDYCVEFGSERVTSERLVIAAGLGSKELCDQVGLSVPIRSERGQILVTERLEPLLPLPMRGLRQTREGTVILGATRDDPGLSTATTFEAAVSLSRNAVRRIPALGKVRLVRQWAGLRTLTPDGYPIYSESRSHPGIFVALCHSGVTLAAAHANNLAEAIAAGELPSSLDVFHERRFDVSKVA